MIEHDKNIVIQQIEVKNPSFFSFTETIPPYSINKPLYTLGKDQSLNLIWSKYESFPSIEEGYGISIENLKGKLIINASLNEIENIIRDFKLKGTEIYYKEGKIGIGVLPRFTYKFDIAIPINTLMTAFHLGDGSFGFSIGNGTSQGFVPQILGMGSDENDAGLYFLGKSGNNESSEVPLIIMDGRNNYNSALENRPIFGITSGDYNNYKFIIDQYGRVGIGKTPDTYKLEINGTVKADNFILGEYNIKELITIIKTQQDQLYLLEQRLKKLEI